MKLPLAFFLPKQSQHCCSPVPDPVLGGPEPAECDRSEQGRYLQPWKGRERVLNLSEPAHSSVSHGAHCDVQVSKILFLILIFKRNFLFGLAGPELYWQLPVGRRLLCQELRLAPGREVLSFPGRCGHVLILFSLLHRQVQEQPRGTCRSWLCSHAPQTLANFLFSICAPTQVKQRSQPALKPPRYQQFYFSSDTPCNRESCANSLEKVRLESK